MSVMDSDTRAEVTALAINVTIPEALRPYMNGLAAIPGPSK